MPNNPRAVDNLKPVKKGEVRNPKGKPKGTLNLSTHIQNLLNDENFEANMLDPKVGYKAYKGIPIIALIQVAIQKALNDKDKGIQYLEWLSKYGYGPPSDNTPDEVNVRFVNKVPGPKD